ncbi:MAG: helix-turn-helix domain-containing protein, partial [Prevotellaceae bacterium]|nr:helix-turn-helix domain-containing protein [Prevotellaceae bacterium]
VMRAVNAESALRLKSQPCVKLDEEEKNRVESMLNLLKAAMSGTQLKESQQAERLKAELVKSLGRTLCLEVMLCREKGGQQSSKPRGRKDVIFQNFMLSLFRHYKTQRTVGFYAKELHLSPRYLSNAVRDCSGQSASHWIVSMVVSEAKTLLENSQLSVKEIANRLNFASLSFFGRYFNLYVGMRPNEYRRTVK